MRIYLDACCFNRPFDDQAIDRNRLEAEAVLTILRGGWRHQWTIVGGTAVDLELDLCPAPERRDAAKGLAAMCDELVSATAAEIARMDALTVLGIGPMDSLHIACAESGRCDVLLTTDDKLLKRAKAHAAELRIRVEDPLTWMKEQIEHEPG